MTESGSGVHLDLDLLAQLDEGVAGPEVEQAARRHLEGCAACQDRMAHLRTTRALLSALPPEPMPDAVQSRISAALEQAATSSAGTVVPINRKARIWRSPAVAGAAAAAAVVVLVGALVTGNVIHRDGKKPSTASSQFGAESRPKSADAAATKQWATGANYTAATIATLVPRLVTGTPPAGSSAGGLTAGSAGGGSAGATVNGRGTVPGAVPAATPGVITQEQMRSSPAAIAACGTILAGGVPTVPVAVDFASYEGKPAVIFALPSVGNVAKLDVWVVRSTCSASSLDVYFRRIPRPTG